MLAGHAMLAGHREGRITRATGWRWRRSTSRTRSFDRLLRDEFLAIWRFASLLEAKVLTDDSRSEYNCMRPRSVSWHAQPCEVCKRLGH